MSEFKHTPGPWHVDGTRIRNCAPGIDCIATMQVSNQCNWPEDARLIAAAPDLLAFAKAVVELDRLVDRDDMMAGLNVLVEQAEAAIAKATGESA